jgi:hypothetical protein
VNQGIRVKPNDSHDANNSNNDPHKHERGSQHSFDGNNIKLALNPAVNPDSNPDGSF